MKYLVAYFTVQLADGAACVPISLAKSENHKSPTPFGWVADFLMNSTSYLAIMLPLLLLRVCFAFQKRMFISASKCSGTTGFMKICFSSDIQSSDNFQPSVSDVSSSYILSFIGRVQSCLGLNTLPGARTSKQHYTLLAVCVLGIHFSYILWGIMQERIMTREYDGEMFRTSQFLVFCNRLMTIFIIFPVHFLPLGIVVNPLQHGRRAPFCEFAFASISNILSSWCQYEALKYVSFPTQVLSKACKVIPVMIMGRFVQHRSYTPSEYLTAVLICIGLNMFLLGDLVDGSKNVNEFSNHLGNLSGLFLISGYVLLDSFTSNWQDRMFQKYSLTSFQVMAGVNFWSIALTLLPLVQQGTLMSSLGFAMAHPQFCTDVLLSATCSTTGQVFIFLTIANFGPATFVIITTLRMGLSILISCILFTHPISFVGVLGVILVFASLFLRVYFRKRADKIKPTVADQLDLSKPAEV